MQLKIQSEKAESVSQWQGQEFKAKAGYVMLCGSQATGCANCPSAVVLSASEAGAL